MPDDVPVEGPPRRLTAAGPNAWEKMWGWELLLVATVLIPVAFVLVGDYPVGEKAVIAGCMSATLLAYLFVGRPAIMVDDHRKGAIYVGLLVVLFTPTVLLLPATTFCMFGLSTQCFLALPARRAMIGVTALWAGPAVSAVRTTDAMGGLFNLIVIVTIAIFFSAAFGVWVESITEQSRERARLIEELETSRAEVARLSEEHGAQQERERLAGEIHDTLAQGFSSIIMLVQAAQRQRDPARHLALAVQTAKENLAEARALVSALAPAPLDSASLVDAMRRIAARTGDELGLGVAFEVHGAARPLATRTDVVLIRALQEGLANVRKHAAAGTVRVGLEYGEQRVRLSVADDGAGFAEAETGGYGLLTMRGRVEQAGGTVAVRSTPGAGTTLTVEVPA